MDPLTIIVVALAAGAAVRLRSEAKPAINQIIEDAYADIKALLKRKYPNLVFLERLEERPHSKALRALLIQELADAGADRDDELRKKAEFLLQQVSAYDPAALAELNINLEEKVPDFSSADRFMNKDQIKGTAKDIGGRIQEEAGKLIGNKEQEAKGLGKQVAGKAQKKFGDAKESAKDAIDKGRGRRKMAAMGSNALVRVLYATDRARRMFPTPTEVFGNGRAGLSFGYCDVNIPHDHRMGELESPSFFRLELCYDAIKHIVLLHTVITSKDAFFGELAASVRTSSRSSAFVFIHGYNVTFEDAARRTAQISYDLAFDGASVFYSWPSQGKPSAYIVDEQNIEWAQSDLRVFLEEFFKRSEAENVYLIAHSMGNRALTRAVASLLADEPALRSRLKEVILTAPDIDADVFKRDIAPALAASGRPVTLYASSGDLALCASKKIHGYARAGDSGRGLIVAQGVETIDATNVDTNLMGHSYFAENRSVLSDMFYLIRHGERPDGRFGLRRIEAEAGCYWEFKQ